MKISRTLAAAGIVLLLAGCAADEPAPIAAPPTVTPTPTVEPVLGELVITPEGIGALVLGVPVSEEAESFVEYDPAYCGDGGDDYAGAWKSSDPEEPFLIDSTDGFKKDGDISAIAVYTTGVTTDQGFTVGMTEEQFTAAHPGAELIDELSEIYAIDGTAGTLYVQFEIGKAVAMVAEEKARGELDGALYATDAYHPCA